MELPALVGRYADRFAALGRGEHHVGSPSGAWLVLALAAAAATGDLADRISDALGPDLNTAHRMAVKLLTHLHPAVSAAAAAWTQEGLPVLDPWLGSLPRMFRPGQCLPRMRPTRGRASTPLDCPRRGRLHHPTRGFESQLRSAIPDWET